MSTSNAPRVVIVTRPTPYERLLQQHGTLGQARFFLERRGQSLEALESIHSAQEQALKIVDACIPTDWRRGHVSREELDRFLFEPEDIIVAVGQDGLVANAAKYLDGQSIIGINPSPQHYPGILVPHPPDRARLLLIATASSTATIQARMMVEARLDDGQGFLALNEVFVGHISHQSARYRLHWDGREERQSSSGLIISSGTGSTGWARSIHQERGSNIRLPSPTEPALAFFVREAWPSSTSGTEITEGRIEGDAYLEVISEMDEGGVAFGDGIEADRIHLLWGQRLKIGLAKTRLNLVIDGG